MTGLNCVRVFGLAVAVILPCGCASEDRSQPRGMSLPTAPSAAGPEDTANGSTASTSDSPFMLVADSEINSGRLAVFPPRNEPLQFRQSLEIYYRDTLRRNPIQTAVDLEGGIVWTQEYLRYRLSGCDHLTAVSRVMLQIDNGVGPPECGGTVGFPPRNEPLDFRSNHLESKYRNGLRRSLILSYVDIEGDVVWTTEYFRYRLSGCDHENASAKTLAQVGGSPAPATCQTMFAIWTSANAGWNSIAVTINGRSAGTLIRYFEPGTPGSCTAIDGARVVAEVSPGTVRFSARSDRGGSWDGSRTLVAGQCLPIELTCTNRNCGPVVSTPPTPPPSTPRPPTGPTPTLPTFNNAFHVWGGQSHTQYLGYFSCVFCNEIGSDSINNSIGRYGSSISSTSIRNRISQYGSSISTNSACNSIASNPPRVYNSNRTVYYGELTVNRIRPDAIDGLLAWLQGDVCR